MLTQDVLYKIQQEVPNKFVQKATKSLMHSFVITKERHIERIQWLVFFLYALDYQKLATTLLASFVDDISDTKLRARVDKLETLSIFAFFLDQENQREMSDSKAKQYISLVEKLSNGEVEWFYERLRGYVSDHYKHRVNYDPVALQLTKNDEINGHCWSLKIILSIYQVVKYLSVDGQNREVLNECDTILHAEKEKLLAIIST
uniref:hypothetical protein n=1 Tax=Thaumasiovibrio occultus TaxID=1891184 RepID=UPI000B355A84|nr:hypothetical protein [Thaumasiovibrio occultus]